MRPDSFVYLHLGRAALCYKRSLKAIRSKSTYLVVELDQNPGVGPCRTLLIQNAYLISRRGGQQGVHQKSRNTWYLVLATVIQYHKAKNNRGQEELDSANQ